MQSSLSFYVYLASPPDRLIFSTHQTLEELDIAIACGPALKLAYVLVHAGLNPMDELHVMEALTSSGRPGIYKTAAAAGVLPVDWCAESVMLPGTTKAPRRAMSTTRNGAPLEGLRPGRKVNPESLRSKARIIFAEMYPMGGDLEIKRRMVEELAIGMPVANTYFCDFRKERDSVGVPTTDLGAS